MKTLSMQKAITKFVHDNDTVAIEGFTGFICFSAAHEIIRQKLKDLTLCRMTPDLVYDQMIAAGTAKKLVFSYLGNPGVGSLHSIRRAIEKGIPNELEIEEYSHFGMVSRYMAGAANLPFFPLKSYLGSEIAEDNKNIRFVESPYDNEKIAVVPPLNPDVTIVHAQRCDSKGNTQLWGLLGMQKEAAFAAKKLIVVVEEIVDETVIRSDPNRTIIPHVIVDAIVHQPKGTHPSFVQGYYDRDNRRYIEWEKISRDQAATEAWLKEWIYDLPDWDAYLSKLEKEDPGIWDRLSPGEAFSEPVNYGIYADVQGE